MGRKKRPNQNSSNTVHAESSESESSKDSVQTNEANKTVCTHIIKSTDVNCVRKNIKGNRNKNIHSVCAGCSAGKKSETSPCKDGWVCLRCGSCNCGPEEEDHRLHHYKTPRSDSHCLAYQLDTNLIWCFTCDKEIPMDVNKRVQSCADLIKKQFTSHLSFSPVRGETDTKKMNGTDPSDFLKGEAASQPLQNICLNTVADKPITFLPKVRGLTNLGNTCFFNSVLQCLAQTPGLVDLLREMDIPGEKFHLELDGITIDAELEKHKTSQLSEQLAQVLTEVSGVKGASGDSRAGSYVVNPRRLLDALTGKCPQFEGGDQHDAHELLRHLLDSVHMEDLRRYQKAILAHIGYNKNLEQLDEEKKKFGKKLNQKVCDTIAIRPDQIFKGTLVSILQCTVCSHISRTEEPFLDLSLPVAHEKAQPPGVVRRKQNCGSPVEEEKKETTLSKHQQKKEKKARRNRGKYDKIRLALNKPTIKEEDKKDSLDGEQSDADVEDNEDNAYEEQDHKTEIVESGYSSEKQMSARGSPVTTQSPEEETKPEYPVYQSCEPNPELLKPSSEEPETQLAKRAESGLGSIQELTVTIPEEANTECTSQDSLHVNASNGSPDVSSDSQQGKPVDLSYPDYHLPPSSESQLDRTTMVYSWNCSGDFKTHGRVTESVSLSVSPQSNKASPKCSPKGSPVSGSHSNDNMSVCTSLPNSTDNMSVCTSLPNSTDNMSICNSLPENVSTILSSPVKSQNSGSEERPESRMDCHQNRSSPVEPGDPAAGLDSGLLKLSLEGMSGTTTVEDTDEVTESPSMPAKPVFVGDDQNDFVLTKATTNVNNSPVPPPPPSLPLFATQSHSEPGLRYNNTFHKKEDAGEYSLQSCLNQFTTIEMLAGGNKVGCEACTARINKGNKEGKTVYQNSTKQLLISKLPPVVIFHLKRFQVQRCSFRKICRHVDFPLTLDISPFCERSSNDPIQYSLYGVVEHSGTLHGGHYVAYVKVRSQERRAGLPTPGKWYYISDSRVSDIDESQVLKTQAYLLFYERNL